MRSHKLTVSILLFLFCPLVLFSQSEGELCLNIVPKNSFVKVGSMTIDLSKYSIPHCINLSEGVHEVEIWSRGFTVHTEKVEIKTGEGKKLNLGLKNISPEYNVYLNELEKYHKVRLRRSVEMGFMLSVDAVITVFAVNAIRGHNHRDFKDTAIRARETYESTINPYEITTALETYQTASKEYEEERSRFLKQIYTYAPPTLIAYGVTYWLIRKHRRKRPTKPVFEDINPLVKMSFDASSEFGTPYEFGLTLKF